MASTPTEIAWLARWKAVHSAAEYNPNFGIEGAWRQNADRWGYPLEDKEGEVDMGNGQVWKGRTFSGVGLVVWDPANGAQEVGWP